MNIIQSLEDKNLLGQFLKDSSTWQAWLTFLRAFFALPPAKGDLERHKGCTQRTEWPTEPAKEAWLIIGTRGGKSFITALMATYLAVFRKYDLSPGEKGYVLIVAPTKKQSTIIKRYLSSFFNDNPFLNPYLVRETVEEVELSNGVIIAVLSSDYRSLRGFTAVGAVIDEIAYLNIEGSKPDVEVVRALRSRLLSTGGPLICISSPYAKRGTLYDTHKRHFGRDGSSILVWQASSLTMNPTLDAGAIRRAHEEDPEAAKADYDAQFRSDIESYVTREAVEACVVSSRYELPPIRGVHYVAFCDPSGGTKDSMTLAVAHEEDGKKIIDCIRERKPPFSPDDVVREFTETLKRYGISSVEGDRFGGEWPRERFRVYGIRYEVAQKPKSELYKEMLPLINSGEVELLDNQKLVTQIVNLERRTSRGGRDSIDHARGAFDDLANVVAGVLSIIGKKETSVKLLGFLDSMENFHHPATRRTGRA